jgi:hypothetical protein
MTMMRIPFQYRRHFVDLNLQLNHHDAMHYYKFYAMNKKSIKAYTFTLLRNTYCFQKIKVPCYWNKRDAKAQERDLDI